MSVEPAHYDFWDFHCGATVLYKGLVHVVYFNKGALIRFACSRINGGQLAGRRGCKPLRNAIVTCFDCIVSDRVWEDRVTYMRYLAEAEQRQAEYREAGLA